MHLYLRRDRQVAKRRRAARPRSCGGRGARRRTGGAVQRDGTVADAQRLVDQALVCQLRAHRRDAVQAAVQQHGLVDAPACQGRSGGSQGRRATQGL